MKNLKSALILYGALTLLLGAAYPALVTVAVRAVFPKPAAGSLVRVDGEVIGSSLLAQAFDSPAYFWPRPSAGNYGAVPSAASNLGPTSAGLKQAVEERKTRLAPFFSGPVPAELLLASGSGLDPHLSPEAALAQIGHVARARRLNAEAREQLTALVNEQIEGPQWGVLGRPRVNVLLLNLALDSRFPASRPGEK